MICQHVRYEGRVQGVGFRHTARQIAAGFAVAGYVQNLPDRSVELVAQGDAEQVSAFLAAVAERFSGNIARTRVVDEPIGTYQGFEIRH